MLYKLKKIRFKSLVELKSFVMLYKLKKAHLKSSEKAKMFCQIKHLNVIIKYLFDQFSITCRL